MKLHFNTSTFSLSFFYLFIKRRSFWYSYDLSEAENMAKNKISKSSNIECLNEIS